MVEVYVREFVVEHIKEKFPLKSLYDKLESYLTTLETLGSLPINALLYYILW